MDIGQVKLFLGKDWTETMAVITDSLKSDIDLLNRTNESLLSASGKQLRPVLGLLLARLCSPDGQITADSRLFAASCELLHNATLLHDDVADSSDKRRGRPTVYSLLGPTASVLVGDFWLVKAVDCLLKSKGEIMPVISNFAKTLSCLSEGEMLQLQKASSADTTEEDYLRIIICKTASLFETTGYCAALSVGSDKSMVEKVCSYCTNLGIAFQIKDDIFDYNLSADIGKPVGADILEGKITMPLLGAFRNSGPEEEGKIRKMVSQISERPETREEIIRFVLDNKGIEYAYKRLDDYLDSAAASLDSFRDCQEKTYLLRMTDYVRNRNL